MDVGITSICWPELSAPLREAAAPIEQALAPLFGALDFGAGIAQLTIVLIATTPEEETTQKLIKGYDKVSTLRHPVTNEAVKSLSMPIPLQGDQLETTTPAELRARICKAIAEKLTTPATRLPKAFDHAAFAAHLQNALSIIEHAEFSQPPP